MITNGQKVRTKLKNLVIENIGLVDQGANQEAHVALAKRARPIAQVGETVTVATGAVVKFVLKEPSDA